MVGEGIQGPCEQFPGQGTRTGQVEVAESYV